MHQGKQLKDAADKQKNKGVFAKEIGISRDTLYKLYKKQVIPVKYVERLLELGVRLTGSDITKFYSKPGYPLLKLSGSPSSVNGQNKHISKHENKNAHSTLNTLSLAALIQMTLEDLLQLQSVQEDIELLKTINLVIQLKKDLKHLEELTAELKKDNEFLKKLLEKK